MYLDAPFPEEARQSVKYSKPFFLVNRQDYLFYHHRIFGFI
jgi:hypothetical protein